MKNTMIATLGVLIFPTLAAAMGEDDPIISKLTIDQLEVRDTDNENPWAWDASFYIGKDFNKFWLKTEGEKIGHETEAMEVRALFSQAISPYWDLTAGIRHDITPEFEQSWIEIGAQGIAPYFLETEVSLFIGETGKSAIRFEIEKELMITQKWVLAPELEASFHSYNDEATGTGSGLSEMEIGLRLLYEVRREFSPYIGVHWEKLYGNSANYAREEGHDTSESFVVFGFKGWF